MTTRAKEHWNHPKAPDALSVKRADALGERRLHQLEKGEHHPLAGEPLGEF